MRWNVTEIVEAATAGLRDEARRRDEEQAVYGVDSLDELGLHPILRESLRQAGLGVHAEQPYPADRFARRRKAEAKRCDIVLTEPSQDLIDPQAESTLFGDDQALPLEAAYWLEVKTVSQFTVDGPFPRYAAELLSPVAQDLRKLSKDPMIFHAGLLLVLFTADQATARHDLAAWESRCLKRGYPIAAPVVRDFAINDRMGNARATLALAAVRRL
jgi:hypothetical protein